MIGELYEHALAGWARPEIEHADGSRRPLPVEGWLSESPGDKSILDRCEGPTLDIGSGPGRLTVALSERGIPALGIDITPYAVDLARSSGALVMLRDVFDRVPGTGRWTTVLLADGNIGIGGDPAALLRRVAELLAPQGRAIVELEPPGSPLRQEQVRLCHAGSTSAWFPWAYVGADHITDVANDAGLGEVEIWTVDGRWFASIGGCMSLFRTDCFRAVAMLTAPPADDASAQIDGTERNMNGKLRVAAVSVALVVLAGLVLLIVRPGLNPARIRPLPLIAGAWIVFLVAAWLLRTMPRRSAVALILLGGIAVQLAALSAPPKQSNDLYRYVWDGKVQAAGIDPYQYVPTGHPAHRAAERLPVLPEGRVLRQAVLHGQPSGGRPHPRLHQDQPADGAHHLPAGRRGVLPRGALPAHRERLGQADPGHHGARGRAHHGAADVRPGPAGPGRADGGPVVVVPDGGSRGGKQRPRRRGRGRHRHGGDPRAGHRAHPGPDGARRRPARPGHRDQDDPRADRAGGAAPPLGNGRRFRGQRVRRRLHPAHPPGRRQGDRFPAWLPAAGELHHRDQVRDHSAPRPSCTTASRLRRPWHSSGW